MNLRQRLLNGTDRLVAALLALLLAGTVLAFGGEVWWAPTAIAGLVALSVLAWLAHVLLEGRMTVLKSPLSFLWVLAIVLAVVQLAPLPARIASMLSPRSHQAYAQGFFPDRVQAIDSTLPLPRPAATRTPVSVDRSATLHWAAGALVCLALFWATSQFTDRLRRLYLIWGSLLVAFFLNTAFAVVQLSSGNTKLFGMFEPGSAPDWAPTRFDLLNAPNAITLRTVTTPHGPHPAWAILIPEQPPTLGSLMGGPGAYLALAGLALPLALAMTLQLIAPRGSRERLSTRLAESGHGSLVVLLTALLITSAVVSGLLAGPLMAVPLLLGLACVGLPSAWPSGLRWSGLVLTGVTITSVGVGVLLNQAFSGIPGMEIPSATGGLSHTMRVWRDAASIIADFPLVGTGLGCFGTIHPFYKSQDEAQTTALSSLLQWWAESGLVGLAIGLAGLAWCLTRLPGAIGRVGSADRALPFGLIGAAVGFSLYSALYWSIELAAIAIAASALAGVGNRWLAGGTDLFVERG